MRNFSIIGFIIGLVAAILIVTFGPDILAFKNDGLVYGLIGLVVWIGFTLQFDSVSGRRRL